MPSRPDITRTADGYLAAWGKEAVAFQFHRPRHIAGGSQGGLWADVTIVSKLPGQEGLLHEGRHNLLSLSAQVSLSKYLKGRAEDIDWEQVLAQTFRDIVAVHRAGEPAVNLADKRPREAPRPYHIEKLAEKGQLTIWYGEAESGKSLLAIAAAYAVADGNEALLELNLEPSAVYYLDWETDEETQVSRLHGIAKGMGAYEVPTVHYRLMAGPLAEQIDRVQADVHNLGIGLVFIDSLGFACGGALKEEEAAISFHAACRALRCTVVAIGQTRKRQPGERRREFDVFGSTFFRYGARSIWRVQSQTEPESDILNMGLYHDKNNNGPRCRPFGYRFNFGDGIQITSQDVRQVAELAEGLPLADRLAEILKFGPRTVEDLCAETDTLARTVNAVLRGNNRFLQRPEGWGLLEGKRREWT